MELKLSQVKAVNLRFAPLPTVPTVQYIKLHARVESPSASEDPWLKAPVPLPDPWVVGVWECYGIKG